MDDFYSILSKHFSGVSTAEEEELVDHFKKSDPVEYDILLKLWKTGGIEVHDFDSNKAFESIREKAREREEQPVSRYRNIQVMAAAVILLLIGAFATYYILDSYSTPDLIVAENKMASPIDVDLSDGSVVWLSQSAILSYPKEFEGDFREVSLSGKAFFEVAEDKPFPFVVQTSNSKVTVLGTAFNITSFPSLTEVTVQSGIVEVKSLASNKKVVVNENHTAVVRNGDLLRFETKDPNYLGWKSGVFEFHNASLIEVVRDLNTYYSRQLEIDTTQTYDCSLTAKFEKEKLEDILEILRTTCDISVEKVDNVYRIHR